MKTSRFQPCGIIKSLLLKLHKGLYSLEYNGQYWHHPEYFRLRYVNSNTNILKSTLANT